MKRILSVLLSLTLLVPLGFAQSSGLPGPISYSVATGSVNALAVAQNGALTVTGQLVTFLPNLANTSTTPTLTLNSGSAKTITKLGQIALVAGDLTTTAIATVIFDGTDWELQNPQTFSGNGTLPIVLGGTGQSSASTAFNALSPITTLGDMICGTGSNASGRFAGSTSANVAILTQTGTGSVSACPGWSTTPAFNGSAITSLNGSAVASGIVPLAFGGWGANFAAHLFLGNSTGSTAAPSATLLGAYDVSVPSYIASGGSANTYTATFSPAVTAMTAGLQVKFLPTASNTGTAPTLAVNGLTATTITKFGHAALAANDLTTTAIATVIYDGTDWQLQNPATLSNASSSTPPIVASEELVASSATPTFSLSTRESTTILTSNITSFTLASATNAGQEKTLTFCQNGTGNFTVAPPTNVHGFMIVGAVASKCSSQHFTYNNAQGYWVSDSAGVINE